MDDSIIKTIYHQALVELDAHRLRAALEKVTELAEVSGHAPTKEVVDGLRQSYQWLTNYMARGMVDPKRKSIFQALLKQTYDAADAARYAYFVKESASIYYSTCRAEQAYGRSLASLMDVCRRGGPEAGDQPGCDLFRGLLAAGPWDEETQMLFEAFEQDGAVAVEWRQLAVSALTLGVLERFDERKVAALLHLLGKQLLASPIMMRVLAGVVFILLKYERRIGVYASLQPYCALLFGPSASLSEHALSQQVGRLQMQLILTSATQTIEKKLREEIFPAMLRQAPHLRQGLRSSDLSAFFDSGKNPLWQDDRQTRQLEDKFRELADWQKRGADVYMGTFSALKQRYPFFGEISHWLLPFNPHHPALGSAPASGSFLESFMKSDVLCDSDKYSFSLMMREMPVGQQELVKSQLPDGGEAALGEALGQQAQQEALMRHYLQDLYRFYRLYGPAKSLFNPFEQNLLLTQNSYLRSTLQAEAELRELAEFSFSQDNYSTASYFYDLLFQHHGFSATGLQKQGYCYQMQKHYTKAVDCYEKALLLDSTSRWTARHLAQCYFSLGEYGKSLEQYGSLEKQELSSVSVLLCSSECLMRLERFSEALQKLFKANYLTEDEAVREKTHRAIAWCSFVMGKVEQAAEYNDKVLAAAPTATDFLNAGHFAWAQHDEATAVQYYVQCARMRGVATFDRSWLHDDQKYLQAYGIDGDELCMMCDTVDAQLALQTHSSK